MCGKPQGMPIPFSVLLPQMLPPSEIGSVLSSSVFILRTILSPFYLEILVASHAEVRNSSESPCRPHTLHPASSGANVLQNFSAISQPENQR